ncbi:MAG: acyltransferase domain-containing protein [bacterium]
MINSFPSVFEHLNFAPPQHWSDSWHVSEPDYRSGNLFFLADEFIRSACATLKMEPALGEAFLQAAQQMRADPALERLAWHAHVLFFTHDREPEFQSWPMLPASLGIAADMFYAIIMLSGLPHVQAIYRQRQIPESVQVDTLADLVLKMNMYRKTTGRWGLNAANWICRHFTGRLFRLGRLQYMFDSFRQDFRAFRNIRDRRVLLLAEPGINFRTDGQFDGVNGIFDSQAFTSTLDFRVMPIRGNPVTPGGRVVRQTVHLSWAEWVQILAPGDPVLSLHIPAGGKMDYAQCGDSVRAASLFFSKHFPERPVRAWTCDSWMLDPRFQDYLAPDSNMVRFQQEMYLHPIRGRNEGVVGQAFVDAPLDLQKASAGTALQRAVIQHIKNGDLWCGGGSLMFPEDLAWGKQVYRSQVLDDIIWDCSTDKKS